MSDVVNIDRIKAFSKILKLKGSREWTDKSTEVFVDFGRGKALESSKLRKPERKNEKR